jgi:hypothetical protein
MWEYDGTPEQAFRHPHIDRGDIWIGADFKLHGKGFCNVMGCPSLERSGSDHRRICLRKKEKPAVVEQPAAKVEYFVQLTYGPISPAVAKSWGTLTPGEQAGIVASSILALHGTRKANCILIAKEGKQ